MSWHEKWALAWKRPNNYCLVYLLMYAKQFLWLALWIFSFTWSFFIILFAECLPWCVCSVFMQAALNADTISSQINERLHHHTDTGEKSVHLLTGVELKTSNTSCYFKVPRPSTQLFLCLDSECWKKIVFSVCKAWQTHLQPLDPWRSTPMSRTGAEVGILTLEKGPGCCRAPAWIPNNFSSRTGGGAGACRRWERSSS